MTAEETARETCLLNNFPHVSRRMLDTSFPDRPACWMVQVNDDSAVVVYEDEPCTVASVGNHPGRFVNAG